MVLTFLKTYKGAIAIGILLIFLFFVTRLLYILQLPIFTDEAIYLRWAQIAGNDPNWRFISLTDGKGPLYIWFVIVAERFLEDPLFSGRIVSVLSGFVAMIGLFFVGRELFKDYRVGFLSSFLYIILPFTFIYDRIAIYDSLVGAFSVWSLYLGILFTRSLRLDVSLILAGVIGASVLNKSNGFFNLLLLPFLFPLVSIKQWKLRRLFKWAGLGILIAVLSYGMYSMLRLSPFFYIIAQKNTTFVYPIQEWIQHPFLAFLPNLGWLSKWFLSYMTASVILVMCIALVLEKKFLKEKYVLVLWFIIPFFILALFGKTIYPRYILPMVLPLLPLVAEGVFVLARKFKSKSYGFALALILCVSMPLYSDFLIVKDFIHAPIPESDVAQYLRDWPAGGGITETTAFFTEQAKKGPIYIGTAGTFGLLPYAYDIYLEDNENVTIEGYWPIEDAIPKKVLEMAAKMPTYFVFYQPCVPCRKEGEAPLAWPIKKIIQMERPGGMSRLTIYQVNK